jgi:glutamyl-tRNA synthetase
MSKRYADTALRSYREQGYLPGAIMNFLAFLGWHPKDDVDVLSRDELIAQFDLARVQKAGAVFNQEKLDWLNREYLKKMSDAEIAEAARPFFEEEKMAADTEKTEKVVAVVRGRASTLRDFVSMGRLFFELPEYGAELLVWQKAPSPLPKIADILNHVSKILQEMPAGRFSGEDLKKTVSGAIEGHERGEVLWPLRVALSGQASSPDPLEIMEVIGKEESLRRIAVAVLKCETQGK